MTSAEARGPVRLLAGRVGRPHGLRGEVTVDVRTDAVDTRFAVGAALQRGEGGPVLVVAGRRTHQDRLLVRFDGIVDRDGAEALRGVELFVDVTSELDAPDTGDEGWFVQQLVGCAVVSVDGAALGAVTGLMVAPAHDLLVVDHDGREVLVPFVTAIVPVVDVPGRRVVVDPPGGLFEP